ncbi:DUF2157 domain-containing protein [Gaetbulibacter sp. PBL-D1]|uniref:DUF2157 domain-containing protein n=1 Tax=Gaetbulibacter sp. PBL-D1 TaxID=3422594 RepID=UPI003D2ED19A
MNSKLIKELPQLVKDQVISEDVARNIEVYYQSKQDDKPNKLFTVFGVLGSILVGLGVILILAHNWDNFTRATKTIFAFLPLVIGQLFVGYSILKNKSATWKEASGTFLFFAVGSSIALVSQIYNIPGDLSSFLLTWIVLCLPLIYLLKSNALAMLHIVFATYYACNYGYGYFTMQQTPWLYLGLMALVLPHYWQLLKNHPKANVTSIFNWILPLSCTITLGAFVNNQGDYGYLMYVILFGLFYNIGKIPFFDDQKLRRNGYLIFGSLGTVILLLWTSFNWIWKFNENNLTFASQEFFIALFLFVVTAMVLGYSYSKKWIKSFNLFHIVFIMFTVLFFIGTSNSIIPTIAINCIIFALGLITVKIGTDKFHFGILNYGLLIITALVVCRFFDTDMSYVIRGLLFVSVGAGFFITNYVMLKKQKSKLNSKH